LCQLRQSDNLSKKFEDLGEEYYKEDTFAIGLIQAPDRRECSPCSARLSCCVAEIAAWGPKRQAPMCNDDMYVMVYKVQGDVDPSMHDFVQLDGTGRTIHFVKLLDFLNW